MSEAEPGSSGRPGQARLPEPPEPECREETESVRVRVSTNLRSKMAAACDLVSGDHGVQ